MRRRRRILSIATVVACVAAVIGIGSSAAVAASPAVTPVYVQLGDSYSAGNGAGNYIEKTCWRSPNNYGARVAARNGATYVNAACSGGVLDDILEPRPLGNATLATKTYTITKGAIDARAQWLERAKADELCGTPAQPDWYYDYTINSSASLGSLFTATVKCQLTAAPQIDSVTSDTDAVFLTAGGNDLGFTSIVTDCIALRIASSCKTKLDAAQAGLPAMKEKTKRVLAEVSRRTDGNADIYLLGYPHLINTPTLKISSTYDAGAALDHLQKTGDQVQRAAMVELDKSVPGKGDFVFVDVKPDWDHYTHGIDPAPVGADNSNSWLVPVLGVGNVYKEWVHPNPAGWGANALALYAAM